MAGTLIGAVGLSAVPAGATNNNPVGNPTSPALSYEADCTSTLQAGIAAPFVTSLAGNTTLNSSLPTGVAFGFAGDASVTLPGAVIAGLENSVAGSATTSAAITESIGSTDGNATGSYTYTHSFAAVTTLGGSVSGAGTTATSPVVTGDFPAGLAAVPGTYFLSGTGIPEGSVIVAETTGVSVTLDNAATATATESVGYGASMTFQDPTLNTGATAFTTAGVNGQTAGIGVTSVTSVTIGAAIPVLFGGAPGIGTANCLLTGWAAGPVPGPVQTNATTPQLPPGTTTALITGGSSPVFQPGAYVSLVEPPPVANAGTVNLGVGGSKTVTLSTTPGTVGQPVVSCAVSTPPSLPRLTVTISNTPTVCSATLTDAGSGVATVTFAFTATDGYPLTSAPATETVVIGTPPVDQPLQQQITAGQLVLSCSAPPADSVTCPLITLPAVTLNGTQQTSSAPINTIYVSDNRGDPTVGWTVTSYMVATPSNPNSGCDTQANFCNSQAGSNASLPVNQIAASDLAISAVACAPLAGNNNPAPAGGAGGTYATTQTLCTATAGTGGGSFSVNGTFTLTVPSSTAAGTYDGTVEYLVA
jgi:hypothetical protein